MTFAPLVDRQILLIAVYLYIARNICSCQKFIPFSLFFFSSFDSWMCFGFWPVYMLECSFFFLSSPNDISTSCQSFVNSQKEKKSQTTVQIYHESDSNNPNGHLFIVSIPFELPVYIYFENQKTFNSRK